MSHPTRYREIEVSGAPLEMGRQIGEAAREEIRGFSFESPTLDLPDSPDLRSSTILVIIAGDLDG